MYKDLMTRMEPSDKRGTFGRTVSLLCPPPLGPKRLRKGEVTRTWRGHPWRVSCLGNSKCEVTRNKGSKYPGLRPLLAQMSSEALAELSRSQGALEPLGGICTLSLRNRAGWRREKKQVDFSSMLGFSV